MGGNKRRIWVYFTKKKAPEGAQLIEISKSCAGYVLKD